MEAKLIARHAFRNLGIRDLKVQTRPPGPVSLIVPPQNYEHEMFLYMYK